MNAERAVELMNNETVTANASGQLEALTDEDRRALRGSRFASLPPIQSEPNKPRLAHPGGPVATNKAVALAKFLQRKLQEPGGAASLDPDLVERAVQNAKSTLNGDGNSKSSKKVRHVDSFSESAQETIKLEPDGPPKSNKRKRRKKKKKKGLLTSKNS
eukprot:Gb_30255 [translate_table: standard]